VIRAVDEQPEDDLTKGHTYILGILIGVNRVAIENRGAVEVVRMDHDENRLHPELLDDLDSILDELEEGDGPAAMVLTGTGKFFSNGLDLDYMTAHPADAEATLARVHRLLGRVLGLEVPTVAALNGHTFAAGAMLALAFDDAVMRDDRGYFCLPEADLGIPFTPGMSALITSRLSPPVAHRAMVTGHRFTASEALAGGIVSEVAPEGEVLERAVARAEALAGKPREALAAIKRGMYGAVLDLL
jgi:enoyl-CoA hydratase/carnithine racemase